MKRSVVVVSTAILMLGASMAQGGLILNGKVVAGVGVYGYYTPPVGAEQRFTTFANGALTDGSLSNLGKRLVLPPENDWVPVENIVVMDLGEVVSLNSVTLQASHAVREVKFGCAAMWEDMCFNHGPMLQPKYFEKWMVPRLKRITGFLAENGCDIVYVDCDGNINELVPLWLEAGVNCMLPLEIAGGTDPVKLRKKYGHDILLVGGVDKTRLLAGKEEIKKEIQRLKPVVEDGGYIPHLDHLCPPDVTLENYLYYLQVKRDVFGIPEPEPWETRRESYEWATL